MICPKLTALVKLNMPTMNDTDHDEHPLTKLRNIFIIQNVLQSHKASLHK